MNWRKYWLLLSYFSLVWYLETETILVCIMNFILFVIPFDSLEGCDCNALILPDKKKNKKVYTLNWLVFFRFCIEFLESLQLVCTARKGCSGKETEAEQLSKEKAKEVGGACMSNSIVTFVLVLVCGRLKLTSDFVLCRRRRRKHFFCQKASRP